jgi:hypothetical protein
MPPDADGDGQARFDQLADGGVLADVVAHAEVAAEHVGDVAEKLHRDGLVEPVFGVQRRALGVRQLFIVERRARHELEQNKQHQRDGEQGKDRDEHALENILFQLSVVLLFE